MLSSFTNALFCLYSEETDEILECEFEADIFVFYKLLVMINIVNIRILVEKH